MILKNKIYDLINAMNLNLYFYFLEGEDVNYELEDGVLTFEVSSCLEDEDGYAYKEGVEFRITSTEASIRYGYADNWLDRLKWEDWENLLISPELDALRKECF